MTLIRLTSDNWDNALMTPEVYENEVLSMSSGDHGSHTAEVVVIPEDEAECRGYWKRVYDPHQPDEFLVTKVEAYCPENETGRGYFYSS